VKRDAKAVNNLAEIRLGTSSFTATGWDGSFYPTDMKSNDRLAFEVRGREAIVWDHRLPLNGVMQNEVADRAVSWQEFLLFSTFGCFT
jgi:hypothetical protein